MFFGCASVLCLSARTWWTPSRELVDHIHRFSTRHSRSRSFGEVKVSFVLTYFLTSFRYLAGVATCEGRQIFWGHMWLPWLCVVSMIMCAYLGCFFYVSLVVSFSHFFRISSSFPFAFFLARHDPFMKVKSSFANSFLQGSFLFLLQRNNNKRALVYV